MALQDLVNVNISLLTSSVSGQGFGTPIFIGMHRWFHERVRVYSSVAAAADDFPTDSEEYAAVNSYFAGGASHPILIGRREADAIISVSELTEGATYSFDIEVGSGASLSVSYTTASLDTQETVIDAFIAAITGSTEVEAAITATKEGTGASAVLRIVPATASDVFSLSNLANTEVSYSSVETAREVLAATREENDDFYFVTAHDHTEEFVLELSDAVEALSKLYFVSNSTAASIGTLQEPAIDIIGKLVEQDPLRTVGLWHQDADTKFPELNYIGYFAKHQPGTYTWDAKEIGLGASRHPTTGIRLTDTQLNNLDNRNCNFIQDVGGINIVRTGKVLGNEWIDVVRSRDFLEARLREAYLNKRINTGKIPYTDSGINSLRSVGESVLNRYVSTETQPNILQEQDPFVFTLPKAREVSFADKQTGVLTIKFVAYLAGAIRISVVQGSLTYEAQ